MTTYDLIFTYDFEVSRSGRRIILSLIDLEDQKKFEELFFPSGTSSESGMTYSQTKADLKQVLDFLGHSFEEARAKFSFLQMMTAWQDEFSDGYIQLDDWKLFFELIAGQRLPSTITLQIVEHC